MNTETRSGFLIVLFGGALFLSAALMFALQPMIGKMLLPLVGGTPQGWIVTMAFFQVMLLAGYFAAHQLSRLPPLAHGVAFIALLGAGCLFLPVSIQSTGVAETPGALDIFRLLGAKLAVPFLAISATSSTLQRLFAATGHPDAKDPYFLYAASNLGSFTGLFLYPLVFEPLWGNKLQSEYWYGGYIALLAAALVCLLPVLRHGAGKTEKAGKEEPVSNRTRLEWVVLAFFPSALLSAVTTHISTDIFSAPLIWVVPLAVYLLTFVLAFGRTQFISFKDITRWHHIVVPLVVALLCVFNLTIRVTVYAMAVHLFAFGVVALACHMRLAALRPKETKRNLTDFYLMIALGGALGGALNAFVVPVVLDRLVEYPALMVLSCLALPAFYQKTPLLHKMLGAFAGFCGLIYIVFVLSNASGTEGMEVDTGMMMADFILFTIAVMLSMNMRTAFFGAAAILIVFELILPRDVVMTTRNFYGMIKIFERPMMVRGKVEKARYMYHGTTTHGIQILGEEFEKLPTAYFWGGGPVSDIFALYNPKKTAIVGLGAGTMNCYAAKDRELTFIELDPAVERVARNEFTFLKACKGKTDPRIIIGDGRLELAKLKDEKFDLIVLDAFSSDTIPSHLLTLEAVKEYLARLKPGGILLFNLSNRYFTLTAPLLRIAEALKLKSRFVLDIPGPKDTHAADSIWFAMAPKASLSPLNDYGWVELGVPQDAPLWTDDHTHMLSVMSFHPALAPPRETK